MREPGCDDALGGCLQANVAQRSFAAPSGKGDACEGMRRIESGWSGDRAEFWSLYRPLVVFHCMNNVEQIEVQVSKLSQQELARFRAWYSKFDADAWDHQVEQDAASGKLDPLAERALQAHVSGSTRTL